MSVLILNVKNHSKRYQKQKKFDDGIALLHNGAVALLKYNQVGSATDLAERMLDLFDTVEMEVNEISRG